MSPVGVPLSFDPGLPRLPVLDDAAAVAALLAPGADVVRVRRQDTKYVPGTSCVAAYELRTRGPTDERLLGAVVVTPDDVGAHPAERDPRLPTLRVALDGMAMRERFRSDACLATPIRYKPGVRCMVRYDVTTSAGVQTSFGKVLSGDARLEASLLTALGRGLAGRPDAPGVLPVTVHWPDLGLVVQPAVVGATELHDLASDPEVPAGRRNALLTRAGRALAALHGTALPEAPRRSLADDVAELRGYQRAVDRADDRCARLLAEAVDRVAAADDGRADRAVTTHGAFRTDQLLLDGDAIVLIDLDTVCAAEPARDLGNLLAYLDWKAVRHPGLEATVADVASAFLAGYAEARPLPRAERVSLYRAASLAKIAGRRFRSLTTREWHLVPDLLAACLRTVPDRKVPA